MYIRFITYLFLIKVISPDAYSFSILVSILPLRVSPSSSTSSFRAHHFCRPWEHVTQVQALFSLPFTRCCKFTLAATCPLSLSYNVGQLALKVVHSGAFKEQLLQFLLLPTPFSWLEASSPAPKLDIRFHQPLVNIKCSTWHFRVAQMLPFPACS